MNALPERELADVLYRFGEERRSRRIAAAIVRHRPIETTDELAGVIVSAVGRRPGGPHPARRTFQALRIAVNRELEELTASLPHAAGLLGPGGRVVVIAYHSLEDGVGEARVPRRPTAAGAHPRSPLVPTDAERAENPRARSAKLRAAERMRGRRMSTAARKLVLAGRDAGSACAPLAHDRGAPRALHTPPHPHRRARRGSPVAFWILVAALATVLIIGIASLSALFVQSSFSVDDLQTNLQRAATAARRAPRRGRARLLAATRDGVGARSGDAHPRSRRDLAAPPAGGRRRRVTRPPAGRLVALLIGMALALGGIVVRLAVLQVRESGTYEALGVEQRVRDRAARAPTARKILDRNGSPLAITLDARDVLREPDASSPTRWGRRDTLAPILGVPRTT